ncbi:MAG: TonB-dependent receptor, plug [Edaphobacter sp.]|nr:TonB-dependent receptor, plug [Edaphobacter sp.]
MGRTGISNIESALHGAASARPCQVLKHADAALRNSSGGERAKADVSDAADVAAVNGRPAVSSLNQYLNTVAGKIDPATSQPYTYTFLTTNSGNPVVRIVFNFLNFFAQDEIRFSPNLSINVGARCELILFPTFDPLAPDALSRSVPNDYSDIAPRLGLTWSPEGRRQSCMLRMACTTMYLDLAPPTVQPRSMDIAFLATRLQVVRPVLRRSPIHLI